MKILLDPQHKPLDCSCTGDHVGTFTFAGYERIVNTLISTGQILLDGDESVVSVVVTDKGLAFKIDEKEK